MIIMLCDHICLTIVPEYKWLSYIGRIAFPIYAFMIVEGYVYTRDFKKYILRLLVFAIISEIPYDLMCGESIFLPNHQNVLWTFLLSLIAIRLIEKAKQIHKAEVAAIVTVVIILTSFILGTVLKLDYYGAGVLSVLVFYFFRKRNIFSFILQFGSLYFLNVEILGAMYGSQEIGKQQFFAIFALIPIWLYKGEKGIAGNWFKYTKYIFYPLHMIVLRCLT